MKDSTTWLRHNDRRAKTAWYIVDNTFYRSSGGMKPASIGLKDIQLHYVRPVSPQEIFKDRNLRGVNLNEVVFDVSYYPIERGPYNYTPDLTPDGKLKNPRQNWGGIMRAITSGTDFEVSGIEYLEFWMMDPFLTEPLGALDGKVYDPSTKGREGVLTLDLGDISEDVLHDSELSYEQGLPGLDAYRQVLMTPFGKVSKGNMRQYTFDAGPDARLNQDVGLDGLKNEEERELFKPFLDKVRPLLNPNAYARVEADPSADDFRYFLHDDYEPEGAAILERYKNFNNLQGNSPFAGDGKFIPSYSTVPDMEDLNGDSKLNQEDAYYSYHIHLSPEQMAAGKNYIVEKIEGSGVSWYHFRIPIHDLKHPNFGGTTGDVSGFKKIRFMRLRMTGMADPVVLRFVNFEWKGATWNVPRPRLASYSRLRERRLREWKDNPPRIGQVSIKEHGGKSGQATHYVSPPYSREERESFPDRPAKKANEHALLFCADSLPSGLETMIARRFYFDVQYYRQLQLSVHAESIGNLTTGDKEMELFLRLGREYESDYFEVTLPLILTPAGEKDPDRIWPKENALKLNFRDLGTMRLKGLDQYIVPNPDGTVQSTIRIVGNPKLNTDMTILIGVRNPGKHNHKKKSVCLWLNDLLLIPESVGR